MKNAKKKKPIIYNFCLLWLHYYKEVNKVDKKKEGNINVKLGGMSLYGTTSNAEVGGYEASGDIENAGRLDKGFRKVEEDDLAATASLKEGDQRIIRNRISRGFFRFLYIFCKKALLFSWITQLI